MLVEGKWAADWQPVQAKDERGGFVRYLGRMLAVPGIRETVDIDHIKRGYYSGQSAESHRPRAAGT